MRTSLYILLGALFGILPTSAMAELTAMKLFEVCSSEARGDKLACAMWITGFESGLFASQSVAREHRVTCLPNGFTGAQARLIIMKFLREKPKILHESADVVAFFALTEAFPCPIPKSPN